MRIAISLFLILALAVPISAQRGDEPKGEWDEFRFTPYDKEVSAGLREVQQLIGGRESLLQSYEQTDQSIIETERAIEKLYQDQINTGKAALAYYEALVNFKFPEPEYDDTNERLNDEIASDKEIDIWSDIEAEQPPIPPLFRIRSLSETRDGISVEIENLGDPIDALISVADSQNTIISNPYHIELRNWDYARHISFGLLHRSDKINLLIQSAGGKHYKMPLFIRQQVVEPRISAFPLEQTAKVGESVEYSIVIEGNSNNRDRYPVRITNLPTGISWQITKIILAATDKREVRRIAVRTLMFSKAFDRHELVLRLTLSKDLPNRSIGQPIPFTLEVGSIRESLSITPIGVGEITVDVPTIVQMRLGESKEILINLANVGTETVEAITIRSAGTIYGVNVKADWLMALAAGERQQLPVTVSVADDASIGEHNIRLVVSSSAGAKTAEFRLAIQPKALGFALFSSITTPALAIMAIIVAIYAGIKAQQFRNRREQERATDYELEMPTDDDTGGD